MINIARIVPIVFFLSACNANFQIPSIQYADDDYIIGRAGWIFGVDCPEQEMNGAERCPERYAPKPRTIGEIKRHAEQINGMNAIIPAANSAEQQGNGVGSVTSASEVLVDSTLRNSVQTLLMMHADEVCSNYQYRLLGTVVGARIGANALDQAIGLLAGVVTGSLASEFLGQVRGAFSSSAGFLDDDFLKASFFLREFEGVQKRKRIMKSIILVAQSYPLKAPDPAVGKVNERYSMMEAISDAAAYHRICDIGYILAAGSELDNAQKHLFAWRFSGEFSQMARAGDLPEN
ncbi:hypothetical protein DEM25_012220 [Oceaniradius stylonematis]|jgi:hypothetical protein|uniref:Uncharacterized protein n=1 Tax=Oceaniradius stylonematis TaxID=2184161 RepID=A0A3A8AKJ2_9HYPH|nr:hypothetical protein [Oceaniradius stylonematis]RKF06373.1 hypothetical protein DEM25_012220 [Oceaniradius stylonematis]